MTGIRSQRKCVPREAIRLSRRQVCARAPARYLFNGQVGGAAAPEQEALAKMMTWSSVPSQCIFCQSPGTVVPATRIWRGAVVRSWRCETCERVWDLLPDEQRPLDRRTGAIDRRRATRADRRGRNSEQQLGDARVRQWKDSHATAPDPCPLCPRCQSARTAGTLKTAFGKYCRCIACGHAWHDDGQPRRTSR